MIKTMKTTILLTLCYLCAVLIGLHIDSTTTFGARLAGEDEVVPTAPQPTPQVRRPLPVRDRTAANVQGYRCTAQSLVGIVALYRHVQPERAVGDELYSRAC